MHFQSDKACCAIGDIVGAVVVGGIGPMKSGGNEAYVEG